MSVSFGSYDSDQVMSRGSLGVVLLLVAAVVVMAFEDVLLEMFLVSVMSGVPTRWLDRSITTEGVNGPGALGLHLVFFSGVGAASYSGADEVVVCRSISVMGSDADSPVGDGVILIHIGFTSESGE